MAAVTRTLSPELSDYLSSHAFRHDAVTRHLVETTRELDKADYQVSSEQAGLLTVLTKLSKAQHCLELGTFTGFSAIAIARGLPENGKLLTCDVNSEYTQIAKEHWKMLGIEGKIDLVLKPAAELLDELMSRSVGYFDLIFIDAVKAEFEYYYECAKSLCKSGGVIAIDNVFRQGRVTHPATDPGTEAIKRLNDNVLRDVKRDFAMVPIGDGLTIVINA